MNQLTQLLKEEGMNSSLEEYFATLSTNSCESNITHVIFERIVSVRWIIL